MGKHLRVITLAISLLFNGIALAQAPQGINYQAVARDANGQPLKGVPINLLFELYDTGGSGGQLLYAESTTKTSDAQTGLFTHVLGSVNTSSFSTALNWAIGTKFLQVTINGNTLSRQQLMSVPYALYANSSGNTANTPSLGINGSNLFIVGSNTVTLPSATPYNAGAGISIIGNTISALSTFTGYTSSSNITVGSNTLNLSATGVNSGVYGGNTSSLSSVPFFSVDANGRLISAGAYTANTLGDLSGPLDNQTVTKLRGNALALTTPTTGQVLQYNGSAWAPANVATGGVTSVVGLTPLSGTITSSGAISMQTLAVAGNYGNAANLSIPTLTLDNFGRVTNASSYTLSSLNLNGDVVGSTGANTVQALRSRPVSTLTPAGGDVLQYFSTPGEWRPAATGVNTWSSTANLVYPSNLLSAVAIGTNTANFNSTNYSLAINGAQYNASFTNFAGLASLPSVAGTSNGRILFDAASNRFMVSEGVGAYVPLVPVAQWVKSLNTVTLSSNTDLVGIGVGAPLAKLDIAGSNTLTNAVLRAINSNSNNTSNTVYFESNGNGSVLNINHLGLNAATSGIKVSSTVSKGIDVLTTANNAVDVSSSSTAHNAFEATHTAATPSVYAGYFDGGLSVRSKAGGAGTNALEVLNNSNNFIFRVLENGRVGINVPSPGYRLAVSDNGTNATIYGTNTSVTSFSTAHGLFGITSNPNTFASGVFGTNTSSSGAGVQGYTGGTSIGVLGYSDGSGAAIQASCSTLSSAAVALLLSNGHIKTSGAAPAIATGTSALYFSGGFTMPTNLNISGNDISGTVSFSTGATGLSLGAFCRVEVTFNKAYTSVPQVILTPTSDTFGLHYVVSLTNNQKFYIMIYRPNNSTVSGPTTLSPNLFSFNYIVIE